MRPGKGVPLRRGEARPGNFHAEMLISEERQRSRIIEAGLSAADPDRLIVDRFLDRVEVDQ